MKEACPEADAWIEKSLPNEESRWVQSMDGGWRYGVMTTNASESFNGVLKGARALPIQALVARTFYRQNNFFVTRREMAENWTTYLSPKNEEILDKRVKEARLYTKTRFSMTSWEVTNPKGVVYSVILGGDNASCTCNIPFLHKLPCAHVIAVCGSGVNVSHHRLASHWYTVDRYRNAYRPEFRPIPDKRYWGISNGPRLLPPKYKPRSGRPPSTRIKGTMDEGREGAKKQNMCSMCKKYGHNKSTCKEKAKNQESQANSSASNRRGAHVQQSW